MSSEKDILVKNSHGDMEFTPYGEFLSYYHAHLQLFTGIIKRKNLPPDQIEKQLTQLKNFMKQNIKKVDHFFENMKSFADMVGYTEETLNTFMHKNFMNALNQVQEQLKKQESKASVQKTTANYDLITEEIVKDLGFALDPNLRFKPIENRVVLENMQTGAMIEPVGQMSIGSSAEVAPKGNAPETAPVFIEKEKLILDEIIQGFGEFLTGQKLEVIEDITPDDIKLDVEELENPDILPVDEIEFEEDNTNENEETDISDILGLVEETAIPVTDESDSFSYNDFTSLLTKINTFMTNKDSQGYNQWLASLEPIEKSFISIRSFQIKETKGETIDWKTLYKNISQKSGLSEHILEKLKTKTDNFNRFKSSLELTARKLSTDPSLSQLVKMAWPHIQRATVHYPDKEQVKNDMQSLFNKIQNQNQRNALMHGFFETLK